MKDTFGTQLFVATIFVLAAFLLPNVAPYPLQDPNEASLVHLQPNAEVEIGKEPSYVPQSNIDAR